jgi:hypothetical protein
MKLIVAGLSCLAVAACALPLPYTTPQGKPEPKAVDAEAVTPRDGTGAIVVYRVKQLKDMDCIYDVAIDGRSVAELRRGELVTLYADPGNRLVDIGIRDANDCKPALARVPLDVVASATTRVRVRADGYYGLKVEATTR